MIAFLDASALIYLIEGQPAVAASVRSELTRLASEHTGMAIGLSRLSWLECRVGPMKRGDTAALAVFDAFFALPDLRWVELDRDVVELAAVIRVRHGLRTPDALQAACCLQFGDKHRFISGDADFRRVAGLNLCRVGG